YQRRPVKSPLRAFALPSQPDLLPDLSACSAVIVANGCIIRTTMPVRTSRLLDREAGEGAKLHDPGGLPCLRPLAGSGPRRVRAVRPGRSAVPAPRHPARRGVATRAR